MKSKSWWDDLGDEPVTPWYVLSRVAALVALVGLLFWCLGCVGALQGGTIGSPNAPAPPSPPAAMASFDLVVCQETPCIHPIAGATVHITEEADNVQTTNADGYTLWSVPLRTATITITADGYNTFIWTSKLVSDFEGQHNVIVLTPSRRFPAEAGPIHFVGKYPFDQNGQVWSGHSYTLFALGGRFFAGESIQPQLTHVALLGFNTVRVFGPLNWPDTWYQPYANTPTPAQLDALFTTVEQAGLRIEYSAITYSYPGAHDFLKMAFDVARSHWGVFIEVANEPEVNGTDPVALMQGIDPGQTPWAYGLDPTRTDCSNPATCFIVPTGAYVTMHDNFRGDQYSPTDSHDAMTARDTLGKHVWDDEPIGVIDPVKFNFHPTSGDLWERPGGGSVRTTNCDVTTSHAAIALIEAGSTTYLSQAGLEGRVPGPDEPIQEKCAEQIAALFGFIPAIAQTGSYNHPGLGDWGATWTPGDTDSLVQHGYSSVVGGQQWAVVAMPSPTWPGWQPINGWRLDAIAPGVPFVARLVK